jgi:hypothetical protein
MQGTAEPMSPARRAFFNQYNLILVGGAAVFSLAALSPWPLLGAAAAEVLWLMIASASPPFKRWAGRQAAAELQAHNAAGRATVAASLEPGYAERVAVVENMAADLRRLVRERGMNPAPLERPERGLDALLLLFVKMAALHQQLSRFSGTVNTAHVEEEIVRLGQAVADEKDPSVKLSLRQALAIGQRRLKQHEMIESQRRAVGVKMTTLEMSFDYLRSHVFGGTTAEELAGEMDEVAAGAAFLTAAEADAHAAFARMQSTVVTRTVTREALLGNS